jgi:UDP-N-acetylmuramate--alanine ligase
MIIIFSVQKMTPPVVTCVVEVFRKFVSKLPEDGFLVLNGDDPHTQELRGVSKAPVKTFGFGENCDLRALNLRPDTEELGSHVQLTWQDGNSVELYLSVPGKHNVYNAMAAILIAQKLGVDPRVAVEILKEFRGVRRRFENKGQVGGILVVDDYAHHPSAVKTTLSAVGNHFKGRIWCVFQPHLYSRTRYLMDEFSKAFNSCDILILDDIYAAREKDPGDISSRVLAEKTREYHGDVRYFGGRPAILKHLLENVQPGDLLITMGAGDVFKVGEAFLAEKTSTVGARS